MAANERDFGEAADKSERGEKRGDGDKIRGRVREGERGEP